MLTPMVAPTSTSKGVCPSSSRRRVWAMGRPLNNSVSIWFNILACMLVARLTPAASYNTTIAVTKAMAKAAESRPSLRPTAVASADTAAECELGIPPAVHNQLQSQLRLVIQYSTGLMI